MKLLKSVSYYNDRITNGKVWDDGISLATFIKTELAKEPSYHTSASGRNIVDTERIYIDGLDQCAIKIINIIKKAGYKDVTIDKPCKKIAKGEMSYLISDSAKGSTVYKIDVACNTKRRISFCNLNVFFQKMDSLNLEKYDRILNKLNNSVGLGLTPAATARNAWDAKMREVGMKSDFSDENKIELPVCDRYGNTITMDTYCRHAYGGGWCYCNAPEAQDIGPGIRFDVHSLYPSILRAGVPSDSMFFYTDSIDELRDGVESCDGTYIIHFSCRFKAKPCVIPFVDTAVIEGARDNVHNLKSSRYGRDDIPCELYMFGPEYEVFKKYYDIKDFRFIDGIGFELTDAGKWYVDGYYADKQNARACHDDESAAVAKLLLNCVIGLFGRKKQGSILAFQNGRAVSVETINNSISHVAVAAYIVGCGRARLADIANQNADRFMYCDTDSIHLKGIGGGIGIEVGDECGKFGVEDHFEHAVFYGRKRYIEWRKNSAKVTFAGLPSKYADTINECLETGMMIDNPDLHYTDKEYEVFLQSVTHLMKCEELDKVTILYRVIGGKKTIPYNLTENRDWWKVQKEIDNSRRYAVM